MQKTAAISGSMCCCFMILALLAEFVSALANCPHGCQCDDNTLVVQCGEGQLDVLPIALNPSIQRLVIRRNKIKTIDSSIQFYAELTFLDLSANHLMTIPQRTFAYQRKLQELYLNDNKIGQLTNRTFLGLVALTVLNLRGNLLSELSAGVFTALQRVEELNLGENRIGYIDARAFESLTQLRILYLDDNALTAVPDPLMLKSLPRLAELMLGGNAFETLGSGIFANVGSGLTRLDLRGAALRNVSHDAFQELGGMLRVLDLSGNRLTRIPTVALSVLQRLEELTLGENDFEVIPEGAFVGLKHLKHLDISGALRLKRVMNGAFAANTNLMHLQLASNKMLSEVQEGAFSGLPHLRHVVLKANALTSLAEGLFPWRDLITLDISENPLACDCRIMWLRNLLVVRNVSQTGDEILCSFPERLRGEALRNLNPQLMGCTYGGEARRQALISALLVGSVATVTALALVLYRCRRKIREFLKKGGSFGRRSKESEYQKTFCDEDYMTRHHLAPLSSQPSGSLPLHGQGHHHHTHFLHHTTPCNMYTAPHQPYNVCSLDAACHTLQPKQMKLQTTQCVPLDDSASFIMLMKANSAAASGTQSQQQEQRPQQQQQQPTKLNHYTKATSHMPGAALNNDSFYSYADVPLVHSVTSVDQAHYRQQPQQYRNEFREALDPADMLDANYIYGNPHYSLPLERSNSNTVTPTPTPPPIPPALPLRNAKQARRSFIKNTNSSIVNSAAGGGDAKNNLSGAHRSFY